MSHQCHTPHLVAIQECQGEASRLGGLGKMAMELGYHFSGFSDGGWSDKQLTEHLRPEPPGRGHARVIEMVRVPLV
jgi:hypothetical protein